ncbi:MAG TPA: hypothetical protein VNL14_22755 [Candidatus Acidoferrales bacterium]|nr:hypothetical protein [Candidatus Acidoferrales bacterium]
MFGRTNVAPGLTLMVLLIVAPAPAGESRQDSKLSFDDKNFITEAGQRGMMEVELGKLAAEKAANPS